jgi:cysteine desulfurase
MGIDLLSISGHKIYGPKGVGALYIRSRNPRINLVAQMSGGGQERGLRSGTLSPPLVVGLGEAARIAAAEWEAEAARLTDLRARLLDGVRAIRDDITVNGTLQARLPGNLSITIPGIGPSDLFPRLNGLAVSSGSACSSESTEASHVLRAIGHDPARVDTTLRLGLGRMTTEDEIDRALAILSRALIS